MSVEANRAATRRFLAEVINGGDLTAFDELVAPDYVDRSGDEPFGRDEYRALLTATREAFPDLYMTAEQIIAEEDRVAIYVRWQATHTAEFMGVPPTGRKISFDGIGMLRFRDGRMVERWNVSDVLGLMRQLGAVPE